MPHSDWKPQVWQRVARHPLGMAGTAAGLVVLLAAILAPLICNDVPLVTLGGAALASVDSPWLESLLDVSRYPAEHDRFFNCALLVLLISLPMLPLVLIARRLWWRRVPDFWSAALVGLSVAALVLWACMLLPAFRYVRPPARYVAPIGEVAWRAPVAQSLVATPRTMFDDVSQAPQLVRGPVARTLAGLRRTLAVVVLATALAAIVGWLLGWLAAISGGMIDAVVVWLAESLHGVPSLLVVLGTLAVLPSGSRTAPTLILLFAISAVPTIIRHVRRETRHELTAALTDSRPIATSGVALTVSAAFAAAFLLGLDLAVGFFHLAPGGDSPGAVLRAGLQQRDLWTVLLPGIVITLAVLALNLLGEAVHSSHRAEQQRIAARRVV